MERERAIWGGRSGGAKGTLSKVSTESAASFYNPSNNTGHDGVSRSCLLANASQHCCLVTRRLVDNPQSHLRARFLAFNLGSCWSISVDLIPEFR